MGQVSQLLLYLVKEVIDLPKVLSGGLRQFEGHLLDSDMNRGEQLSSLVVELVSNPHGFVFQPFVHFVKGDIGLLKPTVSHLERGQGFHPEALSRFQGPHALLGDVKTRHHGQ